MDYLATAIPKIPPIGQEYTKLNFRITKQNSSGKKSPHYKQIFVLANATLSTSLENPIAAMSAQLRTCMFSWATFPMYCKFN